MQIESDTHKAINNILSQVETTTIDIGSTQGYFISSRQLKALRLALDNTTPQLTQGLEELSIQEATTEDQLRLDRSETAKRIRILELRLKQATGEKAAELNLELGKLLSKRARLDRSLKVFTQ